MVYKKPRGTQDWYGDKFNKFQVVVQALNKLANNYGFSAIQTPTFECLDLFQKAVGETTDVVQKELYTFLDKKGRLLALRPEGTSSVVRAYVEDKLYANTNIATKFSYCLNLFRYERPQSGRLREFHQFGVEYLNINSHLNDIECLMLAYDIICMFNLQNHIKLKINYLGNIVQRRAWMEELKTYFQPYVNQLTEDSINRLNKNPLRILDDKVDGKKDFVINAPKLTKFLNNEDHQVFHKILDALNNHQISYIIDDSLVRGLDYYTGLVFEFCYTSPNNQEELTILGGGRYSDLIAQTGGPDQIGLGFAIGLERLLLVLEETNYSFNLINNPNLVLGADSFSSSEVMLSLASTLRQKGLKVVLDLGNFKRDKNAKLAIRQKANYFAFLTQENINNQQLNLENMTTHTIVTLNFEEVYDYIKGC